MSGYGSGRRWHFSAKHCTTDYHALDVRRWAREGFLTEGNAFGWHWTCDGERTGSIRVSVARDHLRLIYRNRPFGGEWRDMDYPVRLDATPCHMGGARRWFRCPVQGCGRRVALLYGGSVFACRHCHQLAYPSQREDASDRAARRADKIRDKLGWEPGILNPPEDKPKGMHWRTYHRLTNRHDQFSRASVAGMLARFDDPEILRELQFLTGHDVQEGGRQGGLEKG